MLGVLVNYEWRIFEFVQTTLIIGQQEGADDRLILHIRRMLMPMLRNRRRGKGKLQELMIVTRKFCRNRINL